MDIVFKDYSGSVSPKARHCFRTSIRACLPFAGSSRRHPEPIAVDKRDPKNRVRLLQQSYGDINAPNAWLTTEPVDTFNGASTPYLITNPFSPFVPSQVRVLHQAPEREQRKCRARNLSPPRFWVPADISDSVTCSCPGGLHNSIYGLSSIPSYSSTQYKILGFVPFPLCCIVVEVVVKRHPRAVHVRWLTISILDLVVLIEEHVSRNDRSGCSISRSHCIWLLAPVRVDRCCLLS